MSMLYQILFYLDLTFVNAIFKEWCGYCANLTLKAHMSNVLNVQNQEQLTYIFASVSTQEIVGYVGRQDVLQELLILLRSTPDLLCLRLKFSSPKKIQSVGIFNLQFQNKIK